LNSVASVGLEKYLAQQYISGATCLMALIVVIIGSVEQYLGIQQHMEIDLVASKEYYFLGTDIFKVLSLDRTHRVQSGKDCLDEMYNRFIKTTENANVLTRKYEDPLFEMPQSSSHLGIEILQSSEELPSSSGSSDSSD